MSLLVDSSVWIDFFNGNITPETDYLNEVLGESLILVGDLILAEVLQGFRQERDFETARDALLKFLVVEMLGRKIAIQSAGNYRLLRSKGITVRKTIDCLIATYCIENNLELLHNDRDFDPFKQHLGLRVLHL
ncbi:MAG: PIN domain nuclease [Anaerolineales bacterium]|nr:PIN domain nuclease [Chloroflexota bacterium]MBL7162564.1 PIN domain nuclease [Anaerolineales bacterium]